MSQRTLLILLLGLFVRFAVGMKSPSTSTEIDFNSFKENLKVLETELDYAISQSPTHSIFYSRCQHAKLLAKGLLSVPLKFQYQHLHSIEVLRGDMCFLGSVLTLSENNFTEEHSAIILGSLRFDSLCITEKVTLAYYFLAGAAQNDLGNMIKHLTISMKFSVFESIDIELKRRLSLINLELKHIYINRKEFLDKMFLLDLSDQAKASLPNVRITVYHENFKNNLNKWEESFAKLHKIVTDLTKDESSYFIEFQPCLQFMISHGYPIVSLQTVLLESVRSTFQARVYANSLLYFLAGINQHQKVVERLCSNLSTFSPMLEIAIEDEFSDAYFRIVNSDLSKTVQSLKEKVNGIKETCDTQTKLHQDLTASLATLDRDIAEYNGYLSSETDISENKRDFLKRQNDIQRATIDTDRRLDNIRQLTQFLVRLGL